MNFKKFLPIFAVLMLMILSMGAVSAADVSNQQVGVASGQVKKYVETEASLPSAVTVGSENVTSPQFLYLLTKSTTNVNSGISSSIAIKNLAVPSKPSESVKSGTLTKSQYITLANSINQFINTNGRLPNFANTNLGTMRYETLTYTYSNIMNFYNTNKRLPNYVSVKPWSTISKPTTPTNTSVPPVQADSKTPLKVTSTDPANYSYNIPTTKLIRITFSNPIYKPNSTKIKLETYSDQVNVPLTYTIQGNSIYIDHIPLKNLRTYRLIVYSNFVQNSTGNGSTYYSFRFKTKTTNLNSYSARLVIPKMGSNIQIRSDTLNANNAIYHYTNSVYFGTPGECAMIGHRTTWTAPMRKIHTLTTGDLIYIYDYTAKKISKYQYQYHEILPNWKLSNNWKKSGPSMLILKTCHPPGSGANKYIVYAKLVSSLPL